MRACVIGGVVVTLVIPLAYFSTGIAIDYVGLVSGAETVELRNTSDSDGGWISNATRAARASSRGNWTLRENRTRPASQASNRSRWTLREEKESMKRLMGKYRGPPGSVDVISTYAGKHINQAGAVLEAEDIRGHHRSTYCFKNYYARYQEEPFSGETFFEWLDFGRGGRILQETGKRTTGDKKCADKAKFDRDLVYYFNETERYQHEVNLEMSESGDALIARYRHSGDVVERSRSKKHPHMYVWDLEERFLMADPMIFEHEFGGSFKHTGLTASMPAISAGEIYVGDHGSVVGMDFSSGHYRPTIVALSAMYHWLKRKSLNLTGAFHLVGRSEWTVAHCDGQDWNVIEIPGYSSTSLNMSCHAVTTSSPLYVAVSKRKDYCLKRLSLGDSCTT
ncbi:hypothetical protein ACHAWF_016963 [Thalassiosira exigua]